MTAYGSYRFLDAIGNFLSKQRNPAIRSFGYGLRSFSPFFGNLFGYDLGKQGFDNVTQAFGLGSITTNNQGDIFTSTLDQVSQNNINVTTVPTSSNMPMSVEGRAALLMFAPPSNPNNPYVLNSFIQYNVLPVT